MPHTTTPMMIDTPFRLYLVKTKGDETMLVCCEPKHLPPSGGIEIGIADLSVPPGAMGLIEVRNSVGLNLEKTGPQGYRA